MGGAVIDTLGILGATGFGLGSIVVCYIYKLFFITAVHTWGYISLLC